MPPGSRTVEDDLRALFKCLLYTRGLRGVIAVNGELTTLVGAVSKTISLLRRKRNRKVVVEFFEKGTGNTTTQGVKPQPAIVIEMESLEELKSKLCHEIPREQIKQLAQLKPELRRVQVICQQERD